MEPKVYKNEEGYLQLLRDILDNGAEGKDRTDVGGCKKLFNQVLWYDLRESFPIPTARPCPLRFAFEEFWMFLRGETNTEILEEKGIDFWKPHTSREFLDSRGLFDVPEGDMGKAYGYQLRNFNGDGVDQLKASIELLRNDPYSRRNVVTFWNPAQSESMSLLPCWYEHKWNVEPSGDGDILHLTVKSRSSDLLFGGPFNTMQYALYLKCVAKLVGMEAGTLTCMLDDVHVYLNQIEYTEELLTRSYGKWLHEPTHTYEDLLQNVVDVYMGRVTYIVNPRPDIPVTLHINKELNTLDDLLNLQWEDFKIEGLRVNKEPFKCPKPKMAV